jgi:hypothetical protein
MEQSQQRRTAQVELERVRGAERIEGRIRDPAGSESNLCAPSGVLAACRGAPESALRARRVRTEPRDRMAALGHPPRARAETRRRR